MPTLQEVNTKFVLNIDNMLSRLKVFEQNFDNLPKITERATDKMNQSFDSVMKSLNTFEDELSKSGKSFDSKTLTKQIEKAKSEFNEFGNVTESTMKDLQKEINGIEWKSANVKTREAFKGMRSDINSVEKQMKKLNDVKFLESLPEESRNAGKQLLQLERDVQKMSKSLNGLDEVEMNKLFSEINRAKQEIKEVGTVSDNTMKAINQDFNNMNFSKGIGNIDAYKDKITGSLKVVNGEIENLNKTGEKLGGGISKGVQDADRNVGLFKGSLGGLAGTIATAFTVGAITNFTKTVVESTAEIKALESQYEQVMGNMKDSTDKYLNEMAQKYNVHPNELKKSMLQYQAILKSKGLSEEEAYKTSKMWLERTVDGSSFANESMEESTSRVMGIIKGEYDSADTIMVNLSQTMLNDKAQEVYGKKWEELTVTQQENLKVQESLRQHNKAGVFGQGIKEADSYERNLARLKNTWTDFLATYGGPALDMANKGLKGGIKIIEGLAKGFQTLGKLIKELSSGNSVNILERLGISHGAANNIINWFNTLKKSLAQAGSGIWDFLKKGFVDIKNFIVGPEGQQLRRAFGNIFSAIISVVKVTFPIIKFIVKDVWNSVVGTIKGAFQIIKGVLQVFSGLFTGDFRKMWDGVKNIFFGAIKLVWNGFQLLFYGRLLKGVIGFSKLFAGGIKSMWSKIVGYFRSFGKSIGDNTIKAFNFLKNGAINIFKSFGSWLSRTTKSIATNVVNGFKSLWQNSIKVFNSLKSGLSKIWSSIKSTAYNAAKFVKDKSIAFFTSLWKNGVKIITNLKNGLFNTWKSIKQHAYDAGKYVRDKLVNFVQQAHDGVKKWIENIKTGFVNLKDNVVSTVKKLGDGIKDKLSIGVNLVIDGINWVADKLGIGSKLNHVKFSTGTPGDKPKPFGGGKPKGGHEGGLATVADKGPGNGKGVRELVQFPDGRVALFEKETTFLMPAGTHVWSNKETEPILESIGYSTGTGGKKGFGQKLSNFVLGNAINSGIRAKKFGDATIGKEKTNAIGKGIVAVGEKAQALAEFAKDPGKLVDYVLKKFGVDFSGFKGITADFINSMYSKIKKGMKQKFTKWFDETGGDGKATAGILDPNLITYFYGHTAAYTRETGRQWHEGVDFPFVYQNLKTPMGGILHRQPYMPGGYGQWVTVDSGNTRLIFGHLSKFTAADGARVKPGDSVGISGNSGFSTGPHLHFGVKVNGSDIDPLPWLRNAKPRKAYANGGIITSPHVALVGEEGSETVIPHDPSKRDRANKLLAITDRIVNPQKYASGTKKPGKPFSETATPWESGIFETAKPYEEKPKSKAKTVTQKTHKVKWGDTLWAISMANKMTVDQLKKLNGLKSNLILPGQILKLAGTINNLAKATSKAKTKAKSVGQSRTEKLLDLAKNLITNASKNPKSKTYKNDLAIGNLITTNMKDIGKQSLATMQKNISAIVKKIDSVIKSATTKVSDLKAKIKNSKDAKVIKSAKEELKQYEAQIKALKKLKENEVLKQTFMNKLYKQRDALLEKMKALKEKEAQLKEDKISYKQSMSDDLMGYAGFGAAKGNTARDFVEFMKYRLGKIRKFSSNISKLKSMGLDPTIIQEMVAGGIESAMPRAEVLIAGGKGYISQINALQAEVKKEIESITSKQSNNIFDPQIKSVQQEIKDNEKQQIALDKQGQSYMTTKIKPKASKSTKPTSSKSTKKKTVTKVVNKDYKVKSGDSLWAIANKYGTTIENIKKINKLNSNLIHPNQILKVPIKVQVEVEDKGTTTKKTVKKSVKNHKVQWGDTLSGIAKKYGSTVDEIKKFNNLNSNTILAGKTLKIPIKTEIIEIVSSSSKKSNANTSKSKTTTSKTAKKTATHIVKAGESLGIIAQKYHTTVAKLKASNGLKSNLIHPKQKLKIPGYANGGIVNIPQLAWIAEGGFAESIISHDPSKRMQQQKIWKDTGDTLGFTNNDELLRKVIYLFEENNRLQKRISEKESAVIMDGRTVGKMVSSHVEDAMVQNQKLINRGLASNGR